MNDHTQRQRATRSHLLCMAAVVALAACGCGGSGGHPPPPPPPPPAPVTQMISVAAAGTISGLGGHYADDISLVLTRL